MSGKYALLAAFAVVSACAPLRTYYKEGEQVAQLQTDQTRCEVAALKEVPVNNQIRYTPERYIPERQICNRDGKCVIDGGYWTGGESYTVDVNEDLRIRVTDQCMATQGYAKVEIPRCEGNVSQSMTPARTVVLPPLTTESCAIKNNDGSWRIVTPGY